ncbi:hypothetical protein ACB094_08G115800 [Castanea mollissima]
MLVFRALPATAIRSFDKVTPTFPVESYSWVIQPKHLSSAPLWVRTACTNWYLDLLLSELLFESSIAAPPFQNKQFEMSFDLSFPKYQFNVIFSMLTTNA